MTESLIRIGTSMVAIILESGFWIVLSLLIAGLVHEFLEDTGFRRVIQHPGRASLFGALGLGAVLPTCSCGVIPLAVSFYLGGARLAAVMTFAAATPVINPAAVLLSYALLGPELTVVYVAFGLTAPLLVGLLTERWRSTGMTPVAEKLDVCCSTTCCSANGGAETKPVPVPNNKRLWEAMRWGFGVLGPTLGLYIGVGVILAAVVMSLVPQDLISAYLGASAPMLSLLLVAVFGASIYVCAVAHIPLVAALLAVGAAPGTAIVFLVTGAATNLPEFIALQKVLGTRTVLVYVSSLIGVSLLAGWLVNLWLLPGFEPVSDPLRTTEWFDIADRLIPVIPEPVSVTCALIVTILIGWGIIRWFGQQFMQVGGRLERPE